MLRVSVRRMRADAVGVLVALAAIGLLALVTGAQMSREFHDSGLAECLAAGPRSSCESLIDRFGERFGSLERLIVPLVLLPGVLGAFVGAPLVAREVEARTSRFWWAQSVTRKRWFVTSAAVAIALAVVAAGVYAAITAVWLDTANLVSDERFGRLYDFQGALPVAATAFAVALGILCGTLLRRTLPAMAATIGVFIAVRVFLATIVRPRLASPLTMSVPFSPSSPLAGTGAWELGQKTVDADGNLIGEGGTVRLGSFVGRCPGLDGGPGAGRRLPEPEVVDACLRELGVQTVVRYHPGSRFWAFQLAESGILLGLAAACLVAGLVVLRRRGA